MEKAIVLERRPDSLKSTPAGAEGGIPVKTRGEIESAADSSHNDNGKSADARYMLRLLADMTPILPQAGE
jgi:hypothetical protein